MSIENYEKIISSNKNLNLLINEKAIGGLASFKKTDDMTPDFIDWVSPKFLISFEAIYKKNMNVNEGALCSLLRASFLANANGLTQMVEIVLPHVDGAIESAEFILQDIEQKPTRIVNHADAIKNDLSYLNKALFNNLEHPKMVERRAKFIQIYVAICNELKDFKPRRNPIEHGIYSEIVTKLSELNLDQSDSGLALQNHEVNASKKQTLYTIGTVLILILIAIRWIYRLNR